MKSFFSHVLTPEGPNEKCNPPGADGVSTAILFRGYIIPYHPKEYKILHPRDLVVFDSLFYLGAFLHVLERNGVENAIGPSGVKFKFEA